MARMKTDEKTTGCRFIAHCWWLLGVVSVMNPSTADAALDHMAVTLWAAFDGSTKVSEQTNGPVITEDQAPGGGNPAWQWIVSDVTGFGADPNFQFAVQNADGTQAQLSWDPISNSDWLTSGGLEGSFTLTLRNGTDPDIVYQVGSSPFRVSLRRTGVADFTVFQGQTGGGDSIPATDAGTYTFGVAPGSLAGIPSDVDLGFTNRGAISVNDSGTATWTEDGTFTLRINHGTRPFCDLENLPLRLRKLIGTGFTVFEGQTGGGDSIPAADTGTYSFAVAPGSFLGIDSSLDLAFTNRGTVSVNDPGSVAWNEDGTFTMRVNPSADPYCDIGNQMMFLRRIVPAPLVISDDGRAGSVSIEVEGDAGPWDWMDYDDGLANSVLTAPDTSWSAALTLSWDAGALEPDETGTGR